MEQLIINVLNSAIEAYKTRVNHLIYGDIVKSFNSENTKIATFIERHPGCIKLPVRLEEGTGYFFLKAESTMLGNRIYIAWEDDDIMHHLGALIGGMSREDRKEVGSYLEQIIMKHLF